MLLFSLLLACCCYCWYDRCYCHCFIIATAVIGVLLVRVVIFTIVFVVFAVVFVSLAVVVVVVVVDDSLLQQAYDSFSFVGLLVVC